MIKVLGDDAWAELRKLAKRAGSRWAAVAYVSSDSAVQFRKDDLLVVDASDVAIQTGQTSARVLRAAFSRGAEVVSLPGLHAKVLVFDDTAFIGSANLSENSTRLHEAGIISNDPRLVSGAIQLIHLFAKAGTQIEDVFLRRIEQLPVSPRRFAPGSLGRKKTISVKQNRAWIIGIPGDVPYPGDESTIEERHSELEAAAPSGTEANWFWWRGKSRFARFASEGDTIISMYRELKDARSTRTVRVYPPTPIRMVFQEPGRSARTYHYTEARDAERTSLSWSQFTKLLRRAGVNRELTMNSCFEIGLDELTALSALWGKGI